MKCLTKLRHVFLRAHPSSGEISFAGFLRGMKLKIQWQQVHNSLVRVDPSGVHPRFRWVLHRRVYNISLPNSLWHIDGYHNSIKWRIVIHGGIDGYWRHPVYLKASDNNQSDTILRWFVGAVSKHGFPSCVRCDKGGENVLVSEYMLIHPLEAQDGKVVNGHSVHNQSIEWLWRNFFAGCVSLYYELFNTQEDNELLELNSEDDMCALHYVFIPRLDMQLNFFC